MTAPRPATHAGPPRLRLFCLRYRLINGQCGVLDTLAPSSCAAIVLAFDLFADRLRTCSARPA